MGIMRVVSEDIENLVKMGYTDKEISKSVDMDKSVIQHIIDYCRKQCQQPTKINSR
jgi:hypothetical protein